VRAHFSAVRLWGQRVAVGSFSYPLGAPASAGTTFAAMTIVGDELQDAVGVLPSPEYCLALCANGDLPDVRLDSVSLEPDDDFYATLAKSIRAYDATVQGMSKEMLAVRESFGTQLAAKDTQIAGQQALVEIVYRSRSWQLTAPLRDARRMAGRMRHVAATRVERVLRSAYRRLPVASQHRWRIKSAVFRRTGWLMRGTASYQHWEGTERRASETFWCASTGAIALAGGHARPDPAAMRGRTDSVGDHPGVRADGMHATLPGIDRPARPEDTHRGHRRGRRVAGTGGRRARAGRGTTDRAERSERGVHQELESRRAGSPGALPAVPQQ
jgi:hypothetical protein